MARSDLIQEIRASFHGISTHNSELSGSTKAFLIANNNAWAISMGEKLVPGEYAINIQVKDIYDNEKNLPTINIVIDHGEPKIRGALDGVAQNAYAQETINYRQRLVGTEQNPRYIIAPVEKASAITWNKRL